MRFAAIDVECATSDFGNICEIGLVVFDGGQEVSAFRSQVRPVIPEFGDWQRWNLPYSLRELMKAPTFAVVWAEAAEILRGLPVIAHNASTVECRHFSAAFKAANVDVATMPEMFCSLELARRMWPDLPKHGLKQLARVFETQLDHHNPVSDARLSAMVVEKSLALSGAVDVPALFHSFKLPACPLAPQNAPDLAKKAELLKTGQGNKSGKKGGRRQGGLPELVKWHSPVALPAQVRSGQHYILSGFSTQRKEALHARARGIGLRSMSMVTPKTDFLVADLQMGPAKLDRCQRYHIPILSESEFLERLQEVEAFN